jgi:uncharacterized membrane protein YheB (UPF0754 family)
MLSWQVYCLPVITTLIGWGTNYLAVKMLFHPKRSIFGLQGVIPRRHKELASKMAELFEKELLSGDELVTIFKKMDLSEELGELVDTKVDLVVSRLKEEIPMAAMFLQGSLEVTLKGKAKGAIMEIAPEIQTRLVPRLNQAFNVRALVEKKVQEFSVERMEKLVLQIASKELRTIEVLGGVIGFVIGMLQVGWVLFMN